jgi:hypothetical protein
MIPQRKKQEHEPISSLGPKSDVSLSLNFLGPIAFDETCKKQKTKFKSYTPHQTTLSTNSNLAKTINQKNKKEEFKFKLAFDFKPELEFKFYAPH